MKKCVLIFMIVIIFGGVLMACGDNDDQTRSQDNTKDPEKNDDRNVAEDPEQHEDVEDLQYEDFEGTYVIFQDEPYHSPIISDLLVLGEDDFRTFNRWDYDRSSPIVDKKIEGNTLTIEVDSDENDVWGAHSETGREEFTLENTGDEKALSFKGSDFTYYSMSKEDLENHYKQSEIDYARIFMTLRGVPSIDSWAAHRSEYEGDQPIIGVSNSNKGDAMPYISDDVDVGYPEDVTTLYLQNKTRQDEISYTYASIENGYIRVYPIPLNHAIRSGGEVIDEAEEKYIKPFEPYEVADFIGNVEFDDE